MRQDSPRIERATPRDLPAVVALLDREFVVRRQRVLSFGVRYPAVYSEANVRNLHVAKVGAQLAAVAAVKKRTWVDQDREYALAMIGGVCTEPSFRGTGLGSMVMKHVEQCLADEKVDLAVLWTTIPAFYERLGWFLLDEGRLGSLAQSPAGDGSKVRRGPLLGEDIDRLETIRRDRLPARLRREQADYRTVPQSAASVEHFSLGDSCALAGAAGGSAYVYEVIGDPAHFASLVSAIHRAHGDVRFNGYPDDDFSRWIGPLNLVKWSPQNLAMWKFMAGTVERDYVRKIHVSFIDRI